METDGFQNEFNPQFEEQYEEGEAVPVAVHQCDVCNKIFVNFKGLQQHAVIHTDCKPFQCEICGRGFRFKSNMFEHRSVHTGFTPHICSFCGKSFRLKGNMKKHMRTHVTTKEELEIAYRPYASNRRPNSVIPDDAIVIRGCSMPYFGTTKSRAARKLLLGQNSTKWIGMLTRNELLPISSIDEKMERVNLATFRDHDVNTLFSDSQSIEFEIYNCPFCKIICGGKVACQIHIYTQHQKNPDDLKKEMFCEKCMRTFPDENMLLQHQSYHTRVQMMIRNHEIESIKATDDPSVSIDEVTYLYLSDETNNNQEEPGPSDRIRFAKKIEPEFPGVLVQSQIVMMNNPKNSSQQQPQNQEIGQLFGENWTNPGEINLNEMILEQTEQKVGKV
ncbi:unnamed protein product [Caenorhabditis angaria]|uniref:C2H2-type domain-containing protein n=1 Tax=Caenorhabditis angaria TaxID=860376 RepID=A0A9P1MY26_9PELO|nr:unnamed protein product [Caenorhabditis angaria]